MSTCVPKVISRELKCSLGINSAFCPPSQMLLSPMIRKQLAKIPSGSQKGGRAGRQAAAGRAFCCRDRPDSLVEIEVVGPRFLRYQLMLCSRQRRAGRKVVARNFDRLTDKSRLLAKGLLPFLCRHQITPDMQTNRTHRLPYGAQLDIHEVSTVRREEIWVSTFTTTFQTMDR